MRIETEALSVAVAQFGFLDAESYAEVDQNIDRIDQFFERAVSGFPGVDLIITPECSVQGVHGSEWEKVLLQKNSTQIEKLKDICRKYSVWGVFNPWMGTSAGRCENTIIIIDNNGSVVHQYVKMYPWVPMEINKAGNDCPVCMGPKGSKIVTLLSSDADYPEMWNLVSNTDANILIRSAHYMHPFQQSFDFTNQSIAITCGIYVVACSAVGMDDQYSYIGKSSILDPTGVKIVEAPDGMQSIIKADLYPGIADYIRKKSKYIQLIQRGVKGGAKL